MLKARILTAAILIPLMVLIIFYLPLPAFCVFTGLATLMAGWEWSRLMRLEKYSSRLLYLFIMFLFFFAMLFIPIPLTLMVTMPFWLIALVLVVAYPRLSTWWQRSVFWRGVMGLFTLVPCWVAVNYIRNLGNGSYALLYLFILIWGADTTAYFIGKKWGKTRLAPEVSPGKSVQGMIGAILFACVAAVAAIYITAAPGALTYWLIGLSLITVLGSIVGDLFESMLKRNAGLKDSGAILPGHGGLLDRIDSLTAAAPIYAFSVFLMMVYAYQ